MSFSFPEIHDFPPFYTSFFSIWSLLSVPQAHTLRRKQLNETTLAQQTQQWIDLIVSYCAKHKLSSLTLDGQLLANPLFNNEKIKRRMYAPFLKYIIDQMVQSGLAEWTSASKEKCLVYTRSMQGWADIVYTWASENGMKGTVLTVFELLQGDGKPPFQELQDTLFLKVLSLLETQGKAQVIPSSNGALDEYGVKFL